MSDSLLDPAEMEAIQAAIRETAPRRASAPPPPPAHEPTRLALISDDRLAEAARPVLINLATRWVRSATRALRSHLPGSWQLDVIGAEVIDGPTAKEALRGGWVAGLRATTGAAPTELVVATHGGVIDIAAARRCGAAAPTADDARPPSALSLRLFQPTGRAMIDSIAAAWCEAFPSEIAASADLAIVSTLIAAPAVVRVALGFAGSVSGQVQIYARPELLVPRPAAPTSVKASAAVIASALANVAVDVVVELGTLRLPLGQLRTLERGQTFTLQGFVDAKVPIYAGGALKAWGTPVVCRGVLAVQIERVVPRAAPHDQGIKS